MLFFNKLFPDDAVRDRVENIVMYTVVFAVSLLLEPFQESPVEICVFKNITNLPCPGCGFTRSFVYMGHLDFYRAFLMHPFGTALFVFWGWSALKDAVWLIFKRNFPFPSKKIWSTGKTIFIFGLLVFGVIRIFFYLPEFELFKPLIKTIDYFHQLFFH